jgi:hypothetical protein
MAAWFVHYWNEIDNRNVCSSEISAREDAMRKACSLMREGHVVSHVAGPNGERIDIVDIARGALRMQATSLATCHPAPAASRRPGPSKTLTTPVSSSKIGSGG